MRSSGFNLRESRPLALLVVVALLLCHGLFSVFHFCYVSQASHTHQAQEHYSVAEARVADHEHAECHKMGASDYFAVLLVIFFGLILRLLLRQCRSCSETFAFRFSERRLRPFVLPSPRGPTAPLTQVFRL